MPRRYASAGLALLLVLLGAALVFLAVLQYRWIGELSAAEEQRARGALDVASRQFSDELERHLGRIMNTFQGLQEEEQLVQRANEWMTGSPEPALLRAIYLIDGDTVRRYDPQSRQLVVSTLPPELVTVRERMRVPLRQRPPLLAELPAIVLPVPRRPPPPAPAPPPRGGSNAGARPAPPPRRPPPPPLREDDGAPDPWQQRPERPRDEGRADGPPDDRAASPRGADDARAEEARRFDEAQRAGRAADQQPAAGDEARPQNDRRPRLPPAFAVALIDRDVLTNVLMAGLVRRFFAADDEVAVVDPLGKIAWRSAPRWDGTKAELDRPILNLGPRQPASKEAQWRLVARHGGALVASIQQARRRNLGVSFAVLLVLAGTTILLTMLLRRAESLRRQQMEFVAGVTHELNTPLAALTSAGQNLADGIIATPEQVTRYGSMIVKESRRLSAMVAQVLDFAGLVAARAPKNRTRVAVPQLVEEACRFVDGVQLDVAIPANLPPVEGDADALARAVQNLVTNAIKYGDGKWVGIRAAAEKQGVAISVDDRGAGVDPRDLPHLFEPFFRGAATAEKVRGSGLGLTLVRQIAVNHGGRVTVERRRGGGSSFTIHLPVTNA